MGRRAGILQGQLPPHREWKQARRHACVSGVEKVSRRSYVVRNLRVYSFLLDIKIKWVTPVQKKLNYLVCPKDQGGAQSKFEEIFRISFATRKKQHELDKSHSRTQINVKLSYFNCNFYTCQKF